MREVNFKDRVPRDPGRVKITPVEGGVNEYIMERADNPTEEGTPLDKATFNSIVHSRLTGRYYETEVNQTTASKQTYTVNPIPSSGWMNATKTTANLNGYEIYGSAASSQSELITAAFDGNSNTFWRGLNNAENYIGFKLPNQLPVSKLRAKFSFTSGDTNTAKIQASNNWTNWVDVSGAHTVGNGQTTEFTLNTTEAYYYYRVLVDVYLDTGIDCYSLEIAEYTVTTLKNAFTVEGVTENWTLNQRLLIITPPSFATLGIVSNEINGVNLNTILQPNKYYELVYNGSAFNVKGV